MWAGATAGEWDKTYAYFDKAWDKVLDNLQTRFATGPIDWTEWLARLKASPPAAGENAPIDLYTPPAVIRITSSNSSTRRQNRRFTSVSALLSF